MRRNLGLEIPPEWDAIDGLRDQVIAFLKEGSEPDPLVDAIAMVVCELSENAIKYGTFAPDADRVHLAVDVTSAAITVEVRNHCSERDHSQLTQLDRTIQWIRGYQDPFEAYLARLKEVAVMNPESGESGLGLVRIAYEGEASLDFYLGADGNLAVSAVYQR